MYINGWHDCISGACIVVTPCGSSNLLIGQFEWLRFGFWSQEKEGCSCCSAIFSNTVSYILYFE